MNKLIGTLFLGFGIGNYATAQIDVDHVISIGRNALYFNDYVVSIGYFNRAIDARPWLAMPYLYRSIAKISLDDYQGAIADATHCIERNPYLSRAYLVRGVAHQNLNEPQLAIKDYREGLRLAPDHEGMRYNLVLSLMQEKAYEEAEEVAEEMLRYSPRNKEIYALRAGLALVKQDTTLALSRIQEALAKDSTMSLPYRLEAGIYANRKAWKLALKSITQAIDLEPRQGSADLYANRGIIHYQMNKLREAMQDYSTALELDPKNKVSRHNRALLRQFVGELSLSLEDWDVLIQEEPKNDIARYNRALLAIQTGSNLRQALQDLDIVLAQYPNFAEGFVQRSLLRKRLGDSKGAERDYWHAWDLQQNASYQARARAIAKRNKEQQTRLDEDRTIDKYNLLVESASKYTPAKAQYSSEMRGRVQDGKVQIEPRPMYYLTYFLPLSPEGKPLDGSVQTSSLVEQFNRQEQSSLTLGLQSLAITLSEKQISDLEGELSLGGDESKATTHLRRGLALSLLQDYKGAMVELEETIKLAPQDALSYLAYATAAERNRQAQAERQASSSTEGSLESKILRGRAESLTTLPHPVLSVERSPLSALDEAIKLAPDFAHAYYNRAYLLAQQGDRSSALRDYSRAIELSPRLAEAYYNRALLLVGEGKVKEAIADLSKAGQLGIYQSYSLIKQLNK